MLWAGEFAGDLKNPSENEQNQCHEPGSVDLLLFAPQTFLAEAVLHMQVLMLPSFTFLKVFFLFINKNLPETQIQLQAV